MSKEMPMKTLRRFAIVLVALVAVPLFAAGTNLVDDVLRMYKSGVPEDAIIQFVQKSNARFDVTADDLIALSDAKVPRTIIKAVLDEADVRNDRHDVRDVRGNDGESRTTVVVERPYFGYYGGWYDPWYYDNYWYGWGPRLGVSFLFGRSYWGGYSYRGYGYRGYGGYHGGYHGGSHGGNHGGHSGGSHGGGHHGHH
jgi:hypothetical protein